MYRIERQQKTLIQQVQNTSNTCMYILYKTGPFQQHLPDSSSKIGSKKRSLPLTYLYITRKFCSLIVCNDFLKITTWQTIVQNEVYFALYTCR